MSQPIIKGRSRDDIIRLVKATKKIIENEGLYFDVCHFIEVEMVKYDNTFSYEYVRSDELPEYTYAYYDPINNIMKIDEEVYLKAYNGDGRHRFTLAHEIGHYFTCDEITYARSSRDNIPAYCDPEWQANTFAAELLMPSDKIKNMSVEEIVSKCKVSKQAAKIALEKAKKSSAYYGTQLYAC